MLDVLHIKDEFNNLPEDFQTKLLDVTDGLDADAIFKLIDRRVAELNVSSRFFGDYLRFAKASDDSVVFHSNYYWRITYLGLYPPERLMLRMHNNSTADELCPATADDTMADGILVDAYFEIEDALKLLEDEPSWARLQQSTKKRALPSVACGDVTVYYEENM